jgi:hypothetical protein
MDNVKRFYDRVFGNNDGKFNAADLPNSAVMIVAGVVDLVMLFAEYRVYSVGYVLTKSVMLAFGFVAVSSLPFYLGQLAFLYNRANWKQQTISILFVLMGLLVSAYYGFADYIFKTNTTIQISEAVSLPLDVSTLYVVAVSCTAVLIVGGLLFVFFDDGFANKRKRNQILGRASLAQEEINIKRDLLKDLTALRADEEALRSQYPQDYERLQVQFEKKVRDNKNPTNGNSS